MSSSAVPASWKPLVLVSRTSRYFEERGVESPRLDAELLLAHALGVSRLELYLDFERTVAGDALERYRSLVAARARERVPVAYLTGQREFWSRAFRVTRDVLIPRPDTELLVRVVKDLAPRRIAEVGVGSGAVIGTLACELPDAELVGIDCCEAALAVAHENLKDLGIAERVALARGDGPEALAGRFDALVSNPPYVPTGDLEGLEPELGHEPRLALDGGPDGLDLVRRLVAAAPALVPGGSLVLEIGLGQAPEVRTLLENSGASDLETHRDLGGVERVVSARFPAEGGG
jgi:release factor glutamine methyltransferase